MFVHLFKHDLPYRGESIDVKLPCKGLQLDPRVNYPNECILDCRYHDDGTTVTLTRVDDEHLADEHIFFKMRVYDPDNNDDVIPDFHSTIYTYQGVSGERAPVSTIVAIVDPTVKTIKEEAFSHCTKMKKCILHGKIETIEWFAFDNCTSLDALFLPSSLKNIYNFAFWGCSNLRILPVPTNINIQQLEGMVIEGCDTFFRITQIQRYEFDYERYDECHQLDDSNYVSDDDDLSDYFDAISGGIQGHQDVNRDSDDDVSDDDDVSSEINDAGPYSDLDAINRIHVHQAIINFYSNLPPLHRECLDINVSRESIHNCILVHGKDAASIIDHDGMTPLHILAMNPHADAGPILECFEAYKSAAIMGDSRGNTPLDYIRKYDKIEVCTSLVNALVHG